MIVAPIGQVPQICIAIFQQLHIYNFVTQTNSLQHKIALLSMVDLLRVLKSISALFPF